MKKVVYWDRTYVIIRDDQEAEVATAIARDRPFWLHHQNGRDFVKPKTIALITKAAYGEYQPDPKTLKIAAGSTQLSEADRAKAREKIEEIKRTAPWYTKARNKKEA